MTTTPSVTGLKTVSEEDMAILVKTLRLTYPNWKAHASKEELALTIEVYYEGLRDLISDDVAVALKEHILSEKFPPTIADLRQSALRKTDERAEKRLRDRQTHEAQLGARRPKGDGSRYQNWPLRTAMETCRVCLDDGWVPLKGSVRVRGMEYSRGSAPCKWCRLGEAIYRSVTTGVDAEDKPLNHNRPRNERDLSDNFKLRDCDLPGDDDRTFIPDTAYLREQEQQNVPRPVLQMMFKRELWPKEWSEDQNRSELKADLT